MVGADLKNLVNEAALLAARRSHSQVRPADFSDSLEKIALGSGRSETMCAAQNAGFPVTERKNANPS